MAQEGNLGFFHFDLYAQALAKVERGHQQDVENVRGMLLRGLISRADLWDYFSLIESQLFRYPAIDPPSFRQSVEAVCRDDVHMP